MFGLFLVQKSLLLHYALCIVHCQLKLPELFFSSLLPRATSAQQKRTSKNHKPQNPKRNARPPGPATENITHNHKTTTNPTPPSLTTLKINKIRPSGLLPLPFSSFTLQSRQHQTTIHPQQIPK